MRLRRVLHSFFNTFRSFATQSANMKKAMVILSEGAEEMETVISIDVLRRGGINVTVAGLQGDGTVECSRQVKIVPDAKFADVKSGTYDVIVCPGGVKGAENLAESAEVGEVLKDQEENDRLIACVCAAPIALAAHKIGSGKTLTSHPSVQKKMEEAGYKYSEDRVVQDGKLITSRGPGTCFEFALKIVEQLEGAKKCESLIKPMLLKM